MWDTLSMRDKSRIMQLAISSGLTNLDTIKQVYNKKFAKGGNTKEPIDPPTYLYNRPGYDEWVKTVPESRKNENYDLELAYNLEDPRILEKWRTATDQELKEGKYHLHSAYEDPNTGIYYFAKLGDSTTNPEYHYETDFYYGNLDRRNYNYDYPRYINDVIASKDFRNRYDLIEDGNRSVYIPKVLNKKFAKGGPTDPPTGVAYTNNGAIPLYEDPKVIEGVVFNRSNEPIALEQGESPYVGPGEGVQKDDLSPSIVSYERPEKKVKFNQSNIDINDIDPVKLYRDTQRILKNNSSYWRYTGPGTLSAITGGALNLNNLSPTHWAGNTINLGKAAFGDGTWGDFTNGFIYGNRGIGEAYPTWADDHPIANFIINTLGDAIAFGGPKVVNPRYQTMRLGNRVANSLEKNAENLRSYVLYNRKGGLGEDYQSLINDAVIQNSNSFRGRVHNAIANFAGKVTGSQPLRNDILLYPRELVQSVYDGAYVKNASRYRSLRNQITNEWDNVVDYAKKNNYAISPEEWRESVIDAYGNKLADDIIDGSRSTDEVANSMINKRDWDTESLVKLNTENNEIPIHLNQNLYKTFVPRLNLSREFNARDIKHFYDNHVVTFPTFLNSRSRIPISYHPFVRELSPNNPTGFLLSHEFGHSKVNVGHNRNLMRYMNGVPDEINIGNRFYIDNQKDFEKVFNPHVRSNNYNGSSMPHDASPEEFFADEFARHYTAGVPLGTHLSPESTINFYSKRWGTLKPEEHGALYRLSKGLDDYVKNHIITDDIDKLRPLLLNREGRVMRLKGGKPIIVPPKWKSINELFEKPNNKQN